MKRTDFHYHLPDELIARYPKQQRSQSRLLQLSLEDGGLHDREFLQLPDLLRAGDLLVFNNTEVIPARLYGHKQTGGKVEVLVERVLSSSHCLAHVKASKSPKPGAYIQIEASYSLRDGDLPQAARRRPD